MKQIKFAKWSLPVHLTVERSKNDGDEQLALSAEAIDKFQSQLLEAHRQALLQAMENGVLPRAVEFKGIFIVSGTSIKGI